MGYFIQLFKLNLVRLCQQRWLLAGLGLLCLMLPLGAGRAGEYLLSRGVGFSGVKLAVTAPEGDSVPQLLEQFMGEMEDIAQYCTIRSMDRSDALDALKRGEVTAVLELPEDFIRGVMWGSNPDLRLIVAGDRPLESLLLLWVGQSACDILSAFQAGVYAVLELYEEAPPPGLTRDQVVFDINFQYISLAMDRSSMFQTEMVSATRFLPVSLHYALSLAAYFALAAAPVFIPLYSGGWLTFQRRLRAAGRRTAAGCFSAVAAGVPALLVFLLPTLVVAAGGRVTLPLMGAGLGMALLCSLFCALCCLTAGSAAGCGVLAFGAALLSLALAGGIVPPVLLPGPVQELGWLSPVTWLRQLAAWALGYPMEVSAWVCLALAGVGMAALSLILYSRQVERQEVGP